MSIIDREGLRTPGRPLFARSLLALTCRASSTSLALLGFECAVTDETATRAERARDEKSMAYRSSECVYQMKVCMQ